MIDDLQRIVSMFDDGQMEALQCIALRIALLKNERFTGLSTIELNISQGQIGDIYSSDKERIRNTRKRRMRG